MKKLSAAFLFLFLAVTAETATAGWTHKVSAYSTPMKASTRGVVTVTIETPSDYTLSDVAPPRLSVIAPEGVTVKSVRRARPEKAIGRSGASTAAFEVALSASKKGSYKLAAEVEFSVCTARSCTPKTETLAFDVNVE